MENYRVGTMKICGDDAVRLKKLLFNPTEEFIKQHSDYMEKLNDSITIKKHDNGFEAEVKDLDLSFLNEDSAECEEQLQITIKVSVKATKQFFTSQQSAIKQAKIEISTDRKFSAVETNNIQNWAA